MGCGSSAPRSVLQPVTDAQTADFDRILAEEQAEAELHFKLLCLGAGETGKSTIIKQLVFLHKQQTVTEEELQSYVRVLHGNVLQVITTLLAAARDFGYDLDDASASQAAIVEEFDSRCLLTMQVVDAIELLWLHCPAIAATYARRGEFWLLEGTPYFLNHMHRFAEENFRPTEDDIIMARKRTTGVVETQMKMGGIAWTVVDVGGQRSERRKWLNCFDNVTGLLFVVNLADYCQVLFEDRQVNRMQESLQLFEDTMKNPMFKNTPVFLILNKKQLIETKPLTLCWPEYEGAQTLRPCIEYIAEQFSSRMPPTCPKPMVLLCAARMKKDVQYCFEDVKDTLLDLKKKDIARAHVKLSAMRAKFREEQIREMEEAARKRKEEQAARPAQPAAAAPAAVGPALQLQQPAAQQSAKVSSSAATVAPAPVDEPAAVAASVDDKDAEPAAASAGVAATNEDASTTSSQAPAERMETLQQSAETSTAHVGLTHTPDQAAAAAAE